MDATTVFTMASAASELLMKVLLDAIIAKQPCTEQVLDTEYPSQKEKIELYFDTNSVNIELISKLSTLKYENRRSRAPLYFTDFPFPKGISKGVELSEGIAFTSDNIRTIRKLIETCSENRGLIISNNSIVGIGVVDDDIVDYRINIESENTWTYAKDEIIIKHSKGVFFIGESDSKVDDFLDSLFVIFEKSMGYRMNFKRIYETAITQPHGTLLVFSDFAKSEAKRLHSCNRGFCISSKAISNSLVFGLTSIDGAVFFDESAKCMGMGFILDGKAVVKGSSERGARYNSALNYIATKKQEKHNYLAVVISEDGMVDIISTLDNFDYIDEQVLIGI
jgi:hypothetical protein